MSLLPSPDRPLALFGCGHMGGAMLAGWLAAGYAPDSFVVIDPGTPVLPEGVRHVTGPAEAPGPFATLLLAVKPQMLDDVADDVARLVEPGGTLVSVLAGVDCAALAERFPGAAILRLMPNLAAAIGKAPLGLYGCGLEDGARASMNRLMAPLGEPIWLPREDDMPAFTALAGSGPAYLYRFIDALAKGGEALGLDPDLAARLALGTVEGSALLAARADTPPGALADRVASKGGSTREGMNVLDADGALDTLLAETLRAARDRNLALAEAAARGS